MDSIRIDKWLWSVRIFKTRSQATTECKNGKVTVNSQQVKASREIKLDDIVTIRMGQLTKTVKVTGLIGTRVSATIAAENHEDLTTEEEYNKIKILREVNHEFRPRGEGRPSKKDRREIDRLKKGNG